MSDDALLLLLLLRLLSDSTDVGGCVRTTWHKVLWGEGGERDKESEVESEGVRFVHTVRLQDEPVRYFAQASH